MSEECDRVNKKVSWSFVGQLTFLQKPNVMIFCSTRRNIQFVVASVHLLRLGSVRISGVVPWHSISLPWLFWQVIVFFGLKHCYFKKSDYLCSRFQSSTVLDPLAQQVEHNTFNVGVLGSSPKRITQGEVPRGTSSFIFPIL